MGGKNEDKISGLRLHISGGNVHIHDDSKKLKFKADSDYFKKEVELAFKTFKKSDGIVEIDGDEDSLCIMKSGQVISMFVKDSTGIKQKLQSFLKNC